MDASTTDLHPAVSTAAMDYSANASAREKLLEHLFVGALLKTLWRQGCRDVDVLRVEVDRGGYDLVLESDTVTRHIQFKSSH